MALRLEYGESGRHLWDAWSATSSKFNAKDQDKAWRSFKRHGGVTLGTILVAGSPVAAASGNEPETTILDLKAATL
jgi:putative DNA primase/helicase